MSALSGMDRAALDYVRANNLPAAGWVCFHLGRAFGWSAEKPRLESIVPLTIVVNVETGIRDVARGGDSENGAEYWDSDPVSASAVESPEAGKTYTCKHSRKGSFECRVLKVWNGWADVQIIQGVARKARGGVQAEAGDKISVRIVLAQWQPMAGSST